MEKLDGPVRKLLELPLRLLSASATGATGISTLIQPFLQRNSTCREKQPLAFVVSPGGLIMGRNLSRIDTGFGAARGWVCQLPPRPWNSGHMSIKYLEYFALLDYMDMRMSCRTGQSMMRLKFRPTEIVVDGIGDMHKSSMRLFHKHGDISDALPLPMMSVHVITRQHQFFRGTINELRIGGFKRHETSMLVLL